jgi:transcriptional regulator with XRE-family HTH domain
MDPGGPGRSSVGGMVASRIGESLRAARTRAGWSREALAYHSGVSWSAIAQIESGRRRDVRLSSLSALADALNVSVDYLIGTAAATSAPHLLEHRVFTHGSDEQFLAAAIPFLADGIERSDCLLAVTTAAQTGLLRDALDDRSQHVEFADSADWYRSPNTALDGYRAFVKEKFDAGASWIRIVGEADWAGSSDAEITAWTRYESMVNLAFASWPVTVVCSYNERSLPADLVASARRTHPEIAHGSDASANPMYREPENLLLEAQSSSGSSTTDHTT